ncbi:flavin reductase family protein [Streptomyces sp. NBC_00335]|uniref:flavin reductase family protein n=1 Tax=unclassified Streptomyces TaxID=2593676 RepID=UPI0022589CDA|nr:MULTISPECIES: flavin reductase family protein [unclassified Streptomyces]MCX5403901.1 flavin reductase family protein [Streptomyces sp. NBC_00086]
MSTFASGVVVLSVGAPEVHAMTANAFGSVSLDPPLVQCCVSHTAVMHGSLIRARSFGVSILSADQEPAARHFADKSRPLGMAQFEGIDWNPGPLTGAPLLPGALAWLECKLVESHVAGDHSLFLGEVLSSVTGYEDEALVFYGGRFERSGSDRTRR